MRRRETRVADPKNCSSAERNERNERRGVLYASAGNRLPGEWRLPQNFVSFGHPTAGLGLTGASVNLRTPSWCSVGLYVGYLTMASAIAPATAIRPPMTERVVGCSPSTSLAKGITTSGVVATIGNTMAVGVPAKAH